MFCRDQRPLCCVTRAVRRPFHFANHALVTSGICRAPQERRASVCGSAAGVALRLRFARHCSPPSAPLSPPADHRPKQWSNLVAGFKEITPTTAKDCPQSHQGRQTWEVFPRFNTLNIPGTHSHRFSQFFLSKFSPRPQCGDIFAELGSVRTGFGLARWHRPILAKTAPCKHEALHRAQFERACFRRPMIFTFQPLDRMSANLACASIQASIADLPGHPARCGTAR